MPENEQELEELADRLYERYGKPLEADHLGEFVAIARDGRAHIGSSLREVALEGPEILGLGVFVYRIGQRAAGRIV